MKLPVFLLGLIFVFTMVSSFGIDLVSDLNISKTEKEEFLKLSPSQAAKKVLQARKADPIRFLFYFKAFFDVRRSESEIKEFTDSISLPISEREVDILSQIISETASGMSEPTRLILFKCCLMSFIDEKREWVSLVYVDDDERIMLETAMEKAKKERKPPANFYSAAMESRFSGYGKDKTILIGEKKIEKK